MSSATAASAAGTAPAPAQPASASEHKMQDGEEHKEGAAASTASATAAVPATHDVPPNQTIYVNNINEKVKKAELKKSLYLVFSQFGNVVEINANDTYKMRGQAWIVFDQLTSATRAQREMNNFLFFGKPLRVTFARTKSDVLAKLDGTYAQRQKRKGPEVDTRPKKGTKDASAKKQKVKGADAAAAGAAAAASAAGAPAAFAPPSAASLEPPPPPHRILFVENLPAAATDLMLTMLFQQYAGFKEARVIAGKGVAFVEFLETHQAIPALEALQGFKVTADNLMKITFAKK